MSPCALMERSLHIMLWAEFRKWVETQFSLMMLKIRKNLRERVQSCYMEYKGDKCLRLMVTREVFKKDMPSELHYILIWVLLRK